MGLCGRMSRRDEKICRSQPHLAVFRRRSAIVGVLGRPEEGSIRGCSSSAMKTKVSLAWGNEPPRAKAKTSAHVAAADRPKNCLTAT